VPHVTTGREKSPLPLNPDPFNTDPREGGYHSHLKTLRHFVYLQAYQILRLIEFHGLINESSDAAGRFGGADRGR